MKINSHKASVQALTLIEVLIIVTVLMVVAAILLPSLAKSKVRSSRISCISNLKQVGMSCRIWAGDNFGKYPMQLSTTNGGAMELALLGEVFPNFQIMSNELSTPKILLCPADRQRHYATNFESDFNNSRVSYFIGLDANETNAAMFLSGDRNITNSRPIKSGLVEFITNQLVGWTGEIHVKQGNIALADGSVQQFSTSGLRDALKQTGVETNRLVMP